MRRASLIITLVALSPKLALGQCQSKADMPRAAGAKTLVGVVSDTSQLPVDSASLLIVTLRREAIANANGVFRFNDIKPGSYEVTARRIGYLPQVHTVVVGDTGGVGAFCLVPFARGLPPVVSAAKRGGLTGVVGDTSFQSLKDVEVSVVGSDRHVINDSTGTFFLDLKSGKYVVRFKRAGYTTRLVSVTIPSDSGRKMVVWMTPSTAYSMFEEDNIRELASRLDTASAARSKLYTREDLSKLGSTDVLQVAKMAAISKVNDDCDVIVDGGPETMPIWQLKTADVEMLEVYVDKAPRNSVTSMSASSTKIRAQQPRAPTGNGCGSIHVYAWLRK